MTTVPINDRYEDNGAISLMARDQYLREVAWMQALEPLEAQEKERLLQRIVRATREPGNAHFQMLAKHARDRLVEGYQPVVIVFARRAARGFHGMEFLDLVSEGTLGVLAAIDRYGGGGYPESYTFDTLVKICIRHAFWAARYGSERWLAMPRRLRYALSQVRRLRAQWSEGHDEEMPISELAAQAGMSEGLIEEVLCLDAFEQMESLQGLLREEDAEDRHNFVSLYAQSVAQEQERQSRFSELVEQVLTARQREVVWLRYGFEEGVGGGRSAEMVSELLGVTYENVRQIERGAEERLRAELEPVEDGSQGSCAFQMKYGDYYNSEEAARVLGVTADSVPRYARMGRLPAIRRGQENGGAYLFPKQAVHELVARRREEMSA